MQENKLPLSKPVLMTALGVLFVFILSGYILYFQANSASHQKDKDIVLLKEKEVQMGQNYNLLQKKYDDLMLTYDQATKAQDTTHQQQRECQDQNALLEAKYTVLQTENEKIKRDLLDAQTKLGIIPPTTSTTTPTTVTPTTNHPIQMLDDTQNGTTPTPSSEPASSTTESATITPPNETGSDQNSTGDQSEPSTND